MVSCSWTGLVVPLAMVRTFFLVANLGRTVAALGHWVVVVELEWCRVGCDGCYSTDCFLVSWLCTVLWVQMVLYLILSLFNDGLVFMFN
jgi:hypothetical protein